MLVVVFLGGCLIVFKLELFLEFLFWLFEVVFKVFLELMLFFLMLMFFIVMLLFVSVEFVLLVVMMFIGFMVNYKNNKDGVYIDMSEEMEKIMNSNIK